MHRIFLRKPVGDRVIDCVAVAMLALIAAAAYVVGVAPEAREDDAEARLYTQMARATSQLEAARSKHREVLDALSETRSQLSRTDLRLQGADRLSERQAAISEVGARTGVEIDQLAAGSTEAGEYFDRMSLRMSGRGSFPDVVLFMRELRATFADTELGSFQFSGQRGAAGATITFVFNLTWYTAPAAGKG